VSLTISDIRALIRSETANDEDDQYGDDQLDVWLTIEYRKLHKRLSARFPELYTSTSATTVLTSTNTITKPVNLAKILHVERLEGDRWIALPKATKVTPALDCYLGWHEEGATIIIAPDATAAAGSYRIKFLVSPSDSFPATDIPLGFEDIIFQNVIAKCKIRIGDDPSPHLALAAQTWSEQVKAQHPRQGNDPEPGFVTGYGVGSYGDGY
jgi:hypothetical protein